MALPNPTSIVTGQVSLSLTDLLSASTSGVLNRNNVTTNFKAVNVQYQGYVALNATSNTLFSPIAPVTLFAVVYVRNAGLNNIMIQYAIPSGVNQNINLDPGATLLYISPSLTSVSITGIAPGVMSLAIFSSAAPCIAEVLVAG